VEQTNLRNLAAQEVAEEYFQAEAEEAVAEVLHPSSLKRYHKPIPRSPSAPRAPSAPAKAAIHIVIYHQVIRSAPMRVH